MNSAPLIHIGIGFCLGHSDSFIIHYIHSFIHIQFHP